MYQQATQMQYRIAELEQQLAAAQARIAELQEALMEAADVIANEGLDGYAEQLRHLSPTFAMCATVGNPVGNIPQDSDTKQNRQGLND